MLAIVQDQQRLPRSQIAGQGVGHRTPSFFADTEHAGQLARHQRLVDQSFKRNKPHSVGIPADERLGDGQRQPCLAGPASPGDGQQAGRLQQVLDFTDLSPPTNEIGELEWQI